MTDKTRKTEIHIHVHGKIDGDVIIKKLVLGDEININDSVVMNSTIGGHMVDIPAPTDEKESVWERPADPMKDIVEVVKPLSQEEQAVFDGFAKKHIEEIVTVSSPVKMYDPETDTVRFVDEHDAKELWVTAKDYSDLNEYLLAGQADWATNPIGLKGTEPGTMFHTIEPEFKVGVDNTLWQMFFSKPELRPVGFSIMTAARPEPKNVKLRDRI